jgi:starch phosphorylase
MSVEDVESLRSRAYNPRAVYENVSELRQALDLIGSGVLCPSDRGLFLPILNSLLEHDHFMVLADYLSYIECQERVSELFHEPKEWARKSVLNVARLGVFSSDRAIKEYCDNIWRVTPVPVELDIIKPLSESLSAIPD